MTDEMQQVILAEIDKLLQNRKNVIVAIDGRCASGKTTLAAALSEALPCNVFHMDDFFLRPEQRTQARYAEPGGNVDRERFAAEVLKPLGSGEAFSYRPFDCAAMKLKSAEEAVAVEPAAVAIVEGSYCCHPELWNAYDLHIFLTVPQEEQMARLAHRSGAKLTMFRERWIPMEERYFAAFSIEERCELCFSGI